MRCVICQALALEAVREVVDYSIDQDDWYTVVMNILKTKSSERPQPFSFWDPYLAHPAKDLSWMAFGYKGRGRWSSNCFTYRGLSTEQLDKMRCVQQQLISAAMDIQQAADSPAEETKDTTGTLQTRDSHTNVDRELYTIELIVAAMQLVLDEENPKFPALPLLAHQVMVGGGFLPVDDFPVPVWIGNADKRPGHQLIKHMNL
jgi:hypothetical protein